MTLEELKILITAETGGVRRELGTLKNQLNSTKTQVTKSTGAMSKAFGTMMKAAAVAFSVHQVIKFGKACVDTSVLVENAWIGLNSVLNGQGKSFNKAKDFVQDYIKDGLVPLQNAVTTYKNLSLRGYNAEQIEQTMIRLKDSASFARQSTLTLGEAVETASEGLKNENSVLVDNSGVTKNVAQMWKEYAASIGVSTANLTTQQKIQAEVNGIMEETRFQTGDAIKYSKTFSGQVSRLKASFTALKTEIGNTIKPILSLFIPALNSAIQVIATFVQKVQGLMQSFGIETNVLNGLTDVSTGVEGLGSDLDNTTESANETKKALDKLAGFDEINKLGREEGGSTTGSADIGKVDTNLNDVSKDTQKATNSMGGLIEKVKELSSTFQTGFKVGLGEDTTKSIERTKEHLKGISSSIKDIFTDSDVQEAARNLTGKLVYNLGISAGSFISIGQSILENITGGFEEYLEEHKDNIKGWLVRMLNISGEVSDIRADVSMGMAEVFEVLRSETAKLITSHFIEIVASTIMGASELFLKIGRDVLDMLTSPFTENAEGFKTAIEKTLKPIEEVMDSLADHVTLSWENINKAYDESIKPLLDSLKTGYTEIVENVLKIYNEKMAPMLERLGGKLKVLIDEHLSPMAQKFIEFGGKLAELFKVIWEKIQPGIIAFQNTVAPVIIPILESIGNAFMTIVGVVSDVVGSIFDILGGVIDFLIGIFTGDLDKALAGVGSIFKGWRDMAIGIFNGLKEGAENSINALAGIFNGLKDGIVNAFTFLVEKAVEQVNNFKRLLTDFIDMVSNFFAERWAKAWGGVVNIFTNVFGSLKGAIKKPLNEVIKVVNTMIDGINSKLNISIGGKKLLDVSIPNIPMLAQGGYVKANSPQLAIIGDNRSEGEIVAPESKITEAVTRAITSVMGSMENMGGNNNTPLELTIKIGDTTIGRAAVDGINKLVKMNGTSGLII